MGGDGVMQAEGFADGNGLLERGDQIGALRESVRRVAQRSRGGVVLVPGEAGIGKTALIRHFCDDAGTPVRVFRTACDPLFTPRPLGPLLELADAMTGAQRANGELFGQIASAGAAFDVATVLLRELRKAAPVVVVIEDVHWADEATLDVIRLLARRADSVPLLLLLSYRDDQLERTHPLRIVVGELSEAGRVLSRLALPGLSRAAVAVLTRQTDVDPVRLHERTAGNPFFVTEVLGAPADGIPHSVRDAVLARAARLSGPARDLLDAAAVVPGQAETWLLEALHPAAIGSLDDCVGSGMLTASPGRIRFRHEIARLVIEESLTPGLRTALHRRVLSVLEKNEDAAGPARLAHHAEAAGDDLAVLRHASAAGEAAAAAGAHREAARLYTRALAVADRLPDLDRAGLLERYAKEAHFATLGTNAGPEPTAALQDALDIYRARGDLMGQGRTLRLLAMQLGGEGKVAESYAVSLEGATILERMPPSPELALTYVNLAAHYGIMRDPQAHECALKAISLGERTGCAEAVYGGLDLVGCIHIIAGDLTGVAELERGRDLAERHRDYFRAGNSHLNLCWMLALRHEWLLAGRFLDPAVTFCLEHGQEPRVTQLRSLQMESLLARGLWDEAVAAADPLLGAPDGPPPVTRCRALTVLGTVRARRGQPGYWPLLDEAADLAMRTEMAYHHQAPVAAARAEAAWLEGRHAAAIAEAERPEPAALLRDPFAALDLAWWRLRAYAAAGEAAGEAGCADGGVVGGGAGGAADGAAAGAADGAAAGAAGGAAGGAVAELPDPYRMLMSGDRAGAASWWRERGQPYEAALASVGSGDADALRQAIEVLRGLGAQPAMAVAARELRGLGERYLPRQPRAATSAHPAGLTTREADVLALLAAGLRNQEIARRLVVSPRTVDHHVSAILRKLSAASRGEAVATAIRLGLVQP
jgi:DNA-binding CsgD family transcriptional regulator/tetratricopeptide (TPR) repeat protein